MQMCSYDEIAAFVKENLYDYRGYELLSEYYSDKNIKQEYLCLENALFYAKEPDDIQRLTKKMAEVSERGGSVPKTAMVILSYNNRVVTQNCLESIRDTTPESAREIVVVDNASADDSVDYLKQQKDIIIKVNYENAGFPKGCNQGIAMAQKESDILLLNNDTVMMPNTLFWLRMGLYENEYIGAAGSVSNKAWKQWSGEKEGTLEYFRKHSETVNIPMKNPVEYRTWLVGFCVLVKRHVMNELNGLDEIFSPGNGEDNDMGIRIHKLGYVCALIRNSYIVHMEHASFGTRPDYIRLLNEANGKIYRKHGFDMFYHYYGNDNIGCFYRDISAKGRVLEINCSVGGTIYEWHAKYPENEYVGIDREEASAAVRDHNPIFDLSTYTDIKDADVEGEFDCICLDTRTIKRSELEEYIKFGYEHLKTGGEFLLSVRNPKFFQEWIPFLLDDYVNVDDKREMIIPKQVEDCIARSGMKTKLWTFSFADIPNDSRGMKIKEILNGLPKEFSDKVTIKNVCFVATK